MHPHRTISLQSEAKPSIPGRIMRSLADTPSHRHLFLQTSANEPAFRFMFPDDKKRNEHVAWLLDQKLRLFNNDYYALTTEGEIKGFSWWIPPGKRPQASLFAQLKAGFWKTPFKFGLQNFSRLLQYQKQESKIFYEYLNGDYWILDAMVTDRSHPSLDLETQLMNPVFKKSQQDQVPCFALTHHPQRVLFYEKYGFKKVLEVPMKGEGAPIAYGLVRDFRTPIHSVTPPSSSSNLSI